MMSLSPFSSKRIKQLPTTIFTTMSRLAVEYNAINLGQGFPDFDGPDWIVEEAFRAMKSGKNQYAPMSGTKLLKEAIAALYKRQYELDYDPDNEITVTAGATEALFSTMLSLIDEGDEVILFEPYYDAHQANTLIAGGVPVYVTLRKPNFHFREEDVARAITPKTKLIVLNNPTNPAGKVFTQSELSCIAALAVKHNLLVLSDEVYEFLTFGDARHIPIASLPGMMERTITISSTGKTFSMTGWKIGYVVANEFLTRTIQRMHQFVTFAVNTPGQYAMAHAMNNIESYLPEFRSMYERKRKILSDGLKETVFAPHEVAGSYFLMGDIPSKFTGDDVECATKLVKEYGVATIPPSVFYGNSDEGRSMLRFCFAKRDETLREGIERLKKFFV